MNLWACADSSLIQSVAPLCRMPGAGTDPFAGSSGRNHGKIAVVPIVGVMTPLGLTSSWLGSEGTAMKPLRREIQRLATNPAVDGVLFTVDSPGGTVMATPELHEAMCDLAAKKPTAAIVDGLCASAALHAAVGVRQIFATCGSLIGSIGVFRVVVDSSEALAAAGIKVIALASSSLKVAGLPGLELTEEQRASLQRLVDTQYLHFVNAVKSRRPMTAAQMEMAATGEIFTARRSQQLGLIDAIGSIDDAIRWLGGDSIDDAMPIISPASPRMPVRAQTEAESGKSRAEAHARHADWLRGRGY